MPLQPYASDPARSRGRLVSEPPSPTRSAFQRDRDRIIHSGAFRKLRNKTQVFIEYEGDYYRTRLTHSLEVAQIARSISRTLGLDEDLTEAVALAHDLGHTCFGHAGEEALHQAMQPYGGFDHNDQAFRVLTELEQHYAAFDGLNLTWETLEGIVKHNGPLLPENSGKPLPTTIARFRDVWDLELDSWPGPEAQIAALADDIAYNTHDIDDGLRAGFLSLEDLETLPVFGAVLTEVRRKYPSLDQDRLGHETVRQVIGAMVVDLMRTTQANFRDLQPESVEDIRRAGRPVVACSPEMAENFRALRKILMVKMYRATKVNRMWTKAGKIVAELFAFFMQEPACLPQAWYNKLLIGESLEDPQKKARIIADYIAGMTDRYAITEYRRLFSMDMII